MTVSSTSNKAVHIGDGSTTVFNYTYQMPISSWMVPYLDETAQIAGFTVNMDPDFVGGNVTFDTAPAQDALVTLLRVVPETQETDYPPYNAFPAESHENALDKLTMISQQLSENLSRVPTEPVGAPEQPEEGYQHNLTVSRDTGDCHPISAITDLQTELDTLTSGVGDNASAISTNAGNIATNTGNIQTNTDAIAAIPDGIGVNQTWQDMTASRAKDTDYTNDTGRSICVQAWTNNLSATSANLTVDGVIVDNDVYNGVGGGKATVSAIVPAGAVYLINGIGALASWVELR